MEDKRGNDAFGWGLSSMKGSPKDKGASVPCFGGSAKFSWRNYRTVHRG